MNMRSHLGRVRGLGSSNEGVHHWRWQRATGITLVPLALWFVFSIIGLIGADIDTMTEWVGRDGNPVFLILFIITMFHHAQLGLQVIVEDYIHKEAAKVIGILFIKITAILLGASCVFAVFRLTFGV